MDVDFWPPRVHSANHQFIAVQSSRLSSDNHLLLEESERDDDIRAFFPCPFCYVEIEVNVLCSHLQNEHCFDLKNAVCPLCAATLGKDAMGHFIAQHTSSLKRRRKSHKSGLWGGGLAPLGRELISYLGSSATSRGHINEPGPDPLLSPFLCSIAFSDGERVQQDESSNKESHLGSNPKRAAPSLSDESHKQDCQMRRQRAEFVQQLISSTIF